MISALAIAARPTGARRWDAPGVMAALAKVKHLDLAEVMIAAGRAARDRDLETPGAIGNPGAPCWAERPVERATPTKTTPANRCGICARPRHECQTTPRLADDGHTFEPDFKAKRDGETVHQIVEALKGELTPTTTPAPPKSLDDLAPEARDQRAAAARAALTADPKETTDA